MKIIVTGSNGQLGSDIIAELGRNGTEAIGADLPEIDITDKEKVQEFIKKSGADAVIHCAAFTNVDLAESESKICRKINYEGTENIAECCKNLDIRLMYISTDYVFSGDGIEAFETDSPKSPCNNYGKTKLEGENAVKELCSKYFIVRISWVFGENGKNFIKTMLRLSKEKSSLTVVNDQIGSPTYTKDLARLLAEMIQTEKYGEYHATNEGFCSWAEFAAKIMEISGAETEIIPVTSDEYKTAAVRPKNSRLSKASLDRNGFSRLPHWENALERFINHLK